MLCVWPAFYLTSLLYTVHGRRGPEALAISLWSELISDVKTTHTLPQIPRRSWKRLKKTKQDYNETVLILGHITLNPTRMLCFHPPLLEFNLNGRLHGYIAQLNSKKVISVLGALLPGLAKQRSGPSSENNQ